MSGVSDQAIEFCDKSGESVNGQGKALFSPWRTVLFTLGTGYRSIPLRKKEILLSLDSRPAKTHNVVIMAHARPKAPNLLPS